jgi:uncharacterized NAD(P)/FAD-binding protein YdhS
MRSVAFVGGGPTTIYTLHALVDKASRPFAVTIFEEQSALGRGTPYRPGWNDPAMLSNIASIEIPPLEQTLVDWLHEQSDAALAALDVDRDKIGERTFYPRLVLGEFFHSQSGKLLERARTLGIQVTVRTRCRVRDVANTPDGMILTIQPNRGEVSQERFDHVVLATGHQWPATPEVRPGYFLSPWPASNLAQIPPCEVGIRGTSLTAIDAMVALAGAHGEFADRDGGSLEYRPAAGSDAFHITMMSRKGLLPEADFYAPIPYEPLSICTEPAIDALIAETDDDLLDRAFALFKAELAAADPDYAARMGLPDVGLEEFHDRYFAPRAHSDPFAWAAANLAEAQRNYAGKVTVAWRYAILRMHEVIERLVPHFESRDYERFSKWFKPVFVDDYATVPHKSIRRMLALHQAGKLDILAIGDKYRIDSYCPEGGAELQFEGQSRSFPVFIEAMGQKALPAREFPFPSLIRQGIIHDYAAGARGPARGIAIDEAFHPISDDIPAERLFCLSLPFILGRHPFHQGITSSHEMGLSVGRELAGVIDTGDVAPAMAETAAARP